MRILLDECIDRRLAKDLVGHEVRTVPQMGWAGSLDGALLLLVAVEFDVFLTVDRNLPSFFMATLFAIATVPSFLALLLYLGILLMMAGERRLTIASS